MFLKNSIKSLYRSSMKTFLLIFMLGLSAFIWELGVSVQTTIQMFLKDCDSLYITLVSIDYVGNEYPDEYINDEAVQQAVLELNEKEILKDQSVQFVEKNEKYFGNVPGFVRKDAAAPAKNETVLLITGAFFEKNSYGLYQARVKDCLFAATDITGSTIKLETGEIKLDRNKSYVLYGIKYEDKSMIPYIYLEEKDGLFIEEVQGDEKIPIEYQLNAEKLHIQHNGVAIIPTDNIDSVLPFHSQQLYIEEGRNFATEDYGKRTCIINGIMAQQLQVSVGDQIDLLWIDSSGSRFFEGYQNETGFSHSGKYEIIGITNKLASMSYQIFTSKNEDFRYLEPTIY